MAYKTGKEKRCLHGVNWSRMGPHSCAYQWRRNKGQGKKRSMIPRASLFFFCCHFSPAVAYRMETRLCLNRVSTQLRNLRQRAALASLSERSAMEMSVVCRQTASLTLHFLPWEPVINIYAFPSTLARASFRSQKPLASNGDDQRTSNQQYR